MMVGEDGSVLVDALVALGVLALALGFGAEAVGDGARRARTAELVRLEVLEARSRLAELGADIPLQPGGEGGEDAGLIWRVEIVPAPGLATRSGRLLDVRVSVGDGRGAPVVLHTRRFTGG